MPVTNKKNKVKIKDPDTKKEPRVETAQPTSPRNDPFIGKKIGNCEVREKMNEGGTAYIYKAFNTSFKMFRVLKILKPTLTEEQDFHVFFIQEAQLTARLDHPNILRVFDTGVVDGHFYIEMEYIEGETLRNLIAKKCKLSERETLHIASQLVKALKYAHNVKIKTPSGKMINGILHRDIKPENIMITDDDTVKLMDFGAAKALDLTSSTMQEMIVGTFHYMSPEQIDGQPMDARSDFFSIGIVMYELFTGEKPFASEKLSALIAKIQASKYKPIKKLRPSISPMTEELIDKLLAKKPGHRPMTTKEIDETIQITLQTLNAWAVGKKARVPFSIRQSYPTIALVISCVALLISVSSFVRRPRYLKANGSSKEVAEKLLSMLDKGREAERKGLWKEAIYFYELIPSVEDGGVVNEYLEAQIRTADISFNHFNQYTKARAILEKLRMDFSDPAIDAYLGEIYFRQALYNEARDRLDAAVNSKKGSVIQQTDEFKREMLYYYAKSIDHQYIYVEKNPELLNDAIMAWEKYIVSSKCKKDAGDKKCAYARNRLKELGREKRNLQK
jgi:serine/threonine protein kinase